MTDVSAIPTLETARLRLRAPGARDFDAYAAFRASDRARFVGGPFSRADSFTPFCALFGHWQVRGYGRWIVADRAEDRALGLVGLHFPEGWPEPELAWSLFDGAEGRGIALEAARAARDFARDRLGWTTAISLIAPGNARSIALAERLGAVHDGDHDHLHYGRLRRYRHPMAGASTGQTGTAA